MYLVDIPGDEGVEFGGNKRYACEWLGSKRELQEGGGRCLRRKYQVITGRWKLDTPES